jgi:D-alanyl-D-alanine carboxypeptidase
MDNQTYIIIAVIAIIAILLFMVWYLDILTPESYSSMENITPTNNWPITGTIVGEPPGVLAGVWKGDKLVHKIEYGYADITNFQPMRWNMHGRIGSITKTFTCTIIMKLMDQGLLSIDDEACNYLPIIPHGITIRQLGNMTSGLYNYTLDRHFNNTLDEDPYKIWNINDLVTAGINHQPMFEPGLGWSYSNTNLLLLGLIAEKVTCQPLDKLYQTMIFDNLGLSNTSLPSAADNSLPCPFYHGYMNGYNNEEKNITKVIRDVTNNNPSWAWAAGGIISNIDDLKIHIKALANGSLLRDRIKNIREDTFVRISDTMDYGFGLFRLNKEWYGHDGQIPGYQTFAICSPSRDVTIVVMCNLFADTQGQKSANVIGKKLMEFVSTNNI